MYMIHCDDDGNERLTVRTRGDAILRLPLINKGTAFTREERVALGLDGLLPPQVCTLEQQVARVMRSLRALPNPLARYQALRALQERQEVLFHAVLGAHLDELLPVVYTPTVGDAVQQFSAIYQHPRGLSFCPDNIDRADDVVAAFPLHDVHMIVATDASAILGIGDQGYGGMAIPIGKLALYTAAGGVSPFSTLPVSLDVGTERADLLEDPLYLGVRQRRLRGDAYLAFTDKFVAAVRRRWPHAVLQWEDLAKDTAFTALERYRHQIASFNDDIQGTGAMALAGVISACRLRGERLRDQRIVIHGAGAGGVGVAWALEQGMIEDGLEAREAKARIWVLDSQGLVVEGRKVEDYKRSFARPGPMLDLRAAVSESRATVLLGLSGQARCFDEGLVRTMATHTARPVIFPLSNPTSATEALPDEISAWTGGAALVATGSPFPGVAQGNNAFIFPGLGFGAIVSGAREITDGMVLASAHALAEYTAERHLARGRILPEVSELRAVSVHVAARVAQRAIAEGVASPNWQPSGDIADIESRVRARAWIPRYLPTHVG
jgi:malate dehydrogenase (oxaloacetate-decarboxylating)